MAEKITPGTSAVLPPDESENAAPDLGDDVRDRLERQPGIGDFTVLQQPSPGQLILSGDGGDHGVVEALNRPGGLQEGDAGTVIENRNAVRDYRKHE